jgi:hypothetical protein
MYNEIENILKDENDLFLILKNLTPKHIHNFNLFFQKYTNEINSAQSIINIISILKDYKYLFEKENKDIYNFTINIINNEINKYVNWQDRYVNE